MIHTFDRAKNDASTVGVDAYIDPQYHAAIFISFEANAIHLRRGDVGIAPYSLYITSYRRGKITAAFCYVNLKC